MSNPITRRKLLRAGAAASASVLIVPAAMARTYSANEKIRFALIGIGGMGAKGVLVASHEQIIAAADVDVNHAGGSIKTIKGRFADAKLYSDYRKLFDEQKHLDAVWVATPDHNHFPASIRALDAGLAVYCEKPLCHDIYEARKLREVAKAKKVATQIGQPGPLRRARPPAVRVDLAGEPRRRDRSPRPPAFQPDGLRLAAPAGRLPCRRASTGTSGKARSRRGSSAAASIRLPGADGSTTGRVCWATGSATMPTARCGP